MGLCHATKDSFGRVKVLASATTAMVRGGEGAKESFHHNAVKRAENYGYNASDDFLRRPI